MDNQTPQQPIPQSPQVISPVPQNLPNHSRSSFPIWKILFIFILILVVIGSGLVAYVLSMKKNPAISTSKQPAIMIKSSPSITLAEETTKSPNSTIPQYDYKSLQAQGADTQIKADISDLFVKVTLFNQTNGHYPQSLNDIATHPYYDRLPTDPLTGQNYKYIPSADLNTYTLSAALSNGQVYSVTDINKNEALDNFVKGYVTAIKRALENYYVYNNQSYPSTLSGLVPNDLRILWKNPITMQPIQYQVTNGSYAVSTQLSNGQTYSVTSP